MKRLMKQHTKPGEAGSAPPVVEMKLPLQIEVKIIVRVPEQEIVVGDHHRNQDVMVALHGAFDAMWATTCTSTAAR